MHPILDKVNSPADLRALAPEELGPLAEEIRALIIRTVSQTGGHLAANLGAVELTMALLKVFDPPTDKIVWDVSHQTYTYKILTGRKDRFHTLRQLNGLSGFALKSESPCDAFGAGHAGTALSAALGMAVARDRRGGAEHVVAIVGDGALGCGSSFEALNNLASATRRLIVILNDNEMSISANVGSIARTLGELLAHPRYNRWKSSVERFAKDRLRLTWLRHIYFRLEEAVKSLFLRNVLFEEFGLRYIGPIDGHNMHLLVSALETARRSDEPILLHVSTQKGKGYPFAEAEPEAWHGTGAFEASTGAALKPAGTLKYSEVFGRTLERMAETNDKLVAITAAMAIGTGLTGFAKRYPGRFFDVGICEEHAVLFAAGLAAEGLRPVVAVYSTFAQRSVDYVIHDVCLQQLPVIFCLDRAGLVGDDGPTHHGVFDIALFRSAPNLVLLQPKDEAELANMLFSAMRWQRPVMIRYPRGGGPGAPLPATYEEIPMGRAEALQEGRDIQLWALGDMIPLAKQAAQLLAAQGLSAGIVNPRFISPLDHDLLSRQAATARCIATFENGVVTGGFGSRVTEVLTEIGYRGACLRFGWPSQFVPQGPFDTMAERFGLTAPAIAERIASVMQ
ncbi:MAG: 1-deoxy-D-xylulose-5-phosphate synthase [Kiritimatiellia bacterium]|jgi:1-deoxy-D-xylulose-5-phosphate synthase